MKLTLPKSGWVGKFTTARYPSDTYESLPKEPTMKPLCNHLIVTWVPTLTVGRIVMPECAIDYNNTDSVKMFKVVASGPGRTTRKGVFIPNEIHPGENVIIDSRVSGRPQELGDGKFFIKNPEQAVIAVVPVQAAHA